MVYNIGMDMADKAEDEGVILNCHGVYEERCGFYVKYMMEFFTMKDYEFVTLAKCLGEEEHTVPAIGVSEESGSSMDSVVANASSHSRTTRWKCMYPTSLQRMEEIKRYTVIHVHIEALYSEHASPDSTTTDNNTPP